MNREQHAKRVDAILDKHKNSEWLKNLWRKVTPPKPPHVEIVTTYGTLKEHHYVVPLLMAARSKPTDTFLNKIEAFIPLDAIIRENINHFHHKISICSGDTYFQIGKNRTG